MNIRIKGEEGEYLVKNRSSILQYKIDDTGKQTGESILHIITDSIENYYDRMKITEKLKEQQKYF